MGTPSTRTGFTCKLCVWVSVDCPLHCISDVIAQTYPHPAPKHDLVLHWLDVSCFSCISVVWHRWTFITVAHRAAFGFACLWRTADRRASESRCFTAVRVLMTFPSRLSRSGYEGHKTVPVYGFINTERRFIFYRIQSGLCEYMDCI